MASLWRIPRPLTFFLVVVFSSFLFLSFLVSECVCVCVCVSGLICIAIRLLVGGCGYLIVIGRPAAIHLFRFDFSSVFFFTFTFSLLFFFAFCSFLHRFASICQKRPTVMSRTLRVAFFFCFSVHVWRPLAEPSANHVLPYFFKTILMNKNKKNSRFRSDRWFHFENVELKGKLGKTQ